MFKLSSFNLSLVFNFTEQPCKPVIFSLNSLDVLAVERLLAVSKGFDLVQSFFKLLFLVISSTTTLFIDNVIDKAELVFVKAELKLLTEVFRILPN